MNTNIDNWGEGIIGFCWDSDGSSLLVQYTETLRYFSVCPELVEFKTLSLDSHRLVGFGHAVDNWWFVIDSEDTVCYRSGVEGEERVLKGLLPGQASMPYISPDGQFLACVVDGSGVGFWSTTNGERLFGVRIIPDRESVTLFGPVRIEVLQWSPDSRRVVIQPGEPIESILVIDVIGERILGKVE